MQPGFRKTLCRVLVAHLLVAGAVAVFPLFEGCRRKPPLLFLPVQIQVEAAVTPPRPPEPPPPRPLPPTPPLPTPPPPKPEVAPPAPPKPPRTPVERSDRRVTRPAETAPTPPAPPTPPRPAPTQEQIRRMLGTPTPVTATATPALDDDTLARIQRLLHAAWVQPGTGASQGMITRVQFRLTPDGRILGERVAASSGSAEVDATALAALRTVSRFSDLPPSFAERHPAITVVFEVR